MVTLIYQQNHTGELITSVSSPFFLLRITIPSNPRGWIKAGYLQQEFLIQGRAEPFIVQSSRSIALAQDYLFQQFPPIVADLAPQLSSQIKFIPHYWLDIYQLTLWEIS